MFRLRIWIVALLLLVIPVQGFAMARMLVCDSAPAVQLQSAHPAEHQQHVHDVDSAAGHQQHGHDGTDEQLSSASGDHSCGKCSSCAMCGGMLVSAAVTFAVSLVSAPKPQGLIVEPATLFPVSIFHVPLVRAA